MPSLALILTPNLTYANSRNWGDVSRETNRTMVVTTNLGWRWREKFAGNVSYVVSKRDQQFGSNDQVQRTFVAAASWRIAGRLPSQLGLQFRRNRIDDERQGQDYEEREAQFTLNTTF